MPPYQENFEKMFKVWNSTDAASKAKWVDEALEHNVHFVDPNHNIMGREAFLKMVDEVQAQIPGAVYAIASEVGFQNNFCRYHWTIKQGDKVLMNGFDVTEVNDAGKVAKIIGFFGELSRNTPAT